MQQSYKRVTIILFFKALTCLYVGKIYENIWINARMALFPENFKFLLKKVTTTNIFPLKILVFKDSFLYKDLHTKISRYLELFTCDFF